MAALSSGSMGEAFCELKGTEEVTPNFEENRTADEGGTLIVSVGELDKAESLKLGM